MRTHCIRTHFLDYVIIYLILFPYFTGVYFFTEDGMQNNYECFASGFVFNMYLSFPIRVKINWYKKLMVHIPAYSFIEVIYYNHEQQISFSFVAILTIMILNLLFDFYQDKMERKNFLIEYYFKKNNEVFQHLFKNVIPEEILIWKKNGLDFANRSALDLFQVNSNEELAPLLIKNIEIQEIEASDNLLITGYQRENTTTRMPLNETCVFEKKIQEILNNESLKEANFRTFTAKICVPSPKKINSPTVKSPTFFGDLHINRKKRQEFDIKMRRFFWDQQEAVLIILNAVEEKNLKSRLEFVNSYLNYLLANLSHEIYTPLNGLLGMLEVSISNLRNNPIIKDNLMIARNSADFLLTITQDLFDFYNIRRGKLIVNISRISLQIYIKELLLMFSSYFEKANLKIESTLENHVIHSDPQKLKQILIGIMNSIMNNVINARISVALKQSLQKENILIEIKALGQSINPMKFSERLNSHTPLKLSRRLTYDKKFNLHDGQLISKFKNCGGGNLELHLIKYLALSLAPEVDVPFIKKERKLEDCKEMEFIYQIYLSDIRENKTTFIEDNSEDRISFEAEYKLDYAEFLESSYTASPLLINEKNLNVHSNEFNFFNKKDSNDKIEERSLRSPLYMNFDDGNSSIFDERKNEDISLKFSLEKHQNNKRPSISLTMPPLLRKVHSHEQIFSTRDSPLNPHKTKSHIILNVDDNRINLMVITNYCQLSEFRVIEASNGLDALEKTKILYKNENLCFDMVFMDCDMPVMDGFKACEEILKFYEEKSEKGPHIVAITANDTYEDRLKAQQCGMKELVKKPLSKSKFEELISFWMMKKHQKLEDGLEESKI